MKFKWERDNGYPNSIDLLDLDINCTDFENARVGWIEPKRKKYHAYVLWALNADVEKIAFGSMREAMRALRLAYRMYRMGGGMYKRRTT